MEIFQVTKDRMMQNFKKLTPFFVVILIALPFVLMNSKSKSSFYLFEEFTKEKMLQLVGENKNGDNISNGRRVHNTSNDNINGGYNNGENNTESKVSNYFIAF